ncbi:DUF362 domain-containing protein [Halorarius litoreus]|uniref:DUF362 domain-containing protein n=1 Tax=Halorarius litoreus TaxID=2962676 RepID=UPI0020CEFBEB|nr:DUF362 domain-containing protein [Halorarius litoreus]
MTSVYCEPLSQPEPAEIRDGIARLVDAIGFDPGGRVLLIPDAHYPYHPSTGQVTNPEVIEQLIDMLEADVVIGLSGSEYIDAERVGRYLGYERLSTRTGCSLINLDYQPRIQKQLRVVGGSVDLAVPEPLVSDAVVVVPTMRSSQTFGVAAGMVTLARAVTDTPNRQTILATTRCCWPDFTLLDGTFAYAETPQKRCILLASEDIVALGRWAADALGVKRSAASHLESRSMPPSLRRRFSEAVSRHRADGTADPLTNLYRSYARISGDLLPPQMIPHEDSP